jgi:hypothetical protein
MICRWSKISSRPLIWNPPVVWLWRAAQLKFSAMSCHRISVTSAYNFRFRLSLSLSLSPGDSGFWYPRVFSFPPGAAQCAPEIIFVLADPEHVCGARYVGECVPLLACGVRMRMAAHALGMAANSLRMAAHTFPMAATTALGRIVRTLATSQRSRGRCTSQRTTAAGSRPEGRSPW